MAERAWGRLVACLAAAFVAAAGTSARAGVAAAGPVRASMLSQTLGAAGLRRLTAASWVSRRFGTASGEIVDVSISPAYASDPGAGQRWASFFSSLIHGSEIGDLHAYIAPLAEVQTICGAEAFGCYGANRLVMMGDANDGVTAQSVARHEYGHHVAYHRLNSPWVAEDWGTKRWASDLNVCSRVASGLAVPGAEDSDYTLNPGEAFAETYRVLNETEAGLPETWDLVDPSFRPDAQALAAVREDVLDPWQMPKPLTIRATFGRGHNTWTRAIPTPLDGDMSVELRNGENDLSLVGADGHEVLARGAWTTTGGKSVRFQVCGQRSIGIRVTRHAHARSFVLRLARP